MSKLLRAASKYIENGVNVVAINGAKTAIAEWKQFQTRMATQKEIGTQLASPNARGIAIICGGVSGGLEVIDVDLKYDLAGTLWESLVEKLKEVDLFRRLKVSRTRNGGYHLFYRCGVIEGNQALAARPKTDEERQNNRSNKGITLIETRGEGGYVVAPPSDGYAWVSGVLGKLEIAERETLFEICRSFNEVIEPPHHNREQRREIKEYGLSPFEDYNKRGNILSLLTKHGWTFVEQKGPKTIVKRPGKSDSRSSGDYNRDLNWFSVFTTNSDFEPNKAYLPYAVYAVLECKGDFSEAAKRLIAEGYGERRQKYSEKLEKEVFKMKSEGADRPALVSMLNKNHGKGDGEATEILDTLERQWGETIATFWDVTAAGKVLINTYKLQQFLSQSGGFYLYFYDKSIRLFKLVRIKDGFVEESSSQQIKSFIKDYILSLPDSFDGGLTPERLIEIVYKGQASYFNENVLEFMEVADPEFLRSEREVAYFPFNNGVVVVGKNSIELKSYTALKKAIWKNQVIDFHIVVDQEFAAGQCEYFDFISQISGLDEERRDYCFTLIGYLLHAYKDAARPYAVILAEETDSNEDGGGTGKGIFVKALSHVLRTVKIDGKNFKMDKSFALQRVSLDTQLISVEDCHKNLDFESFNSQITEGSTIEKKNKDELFIDYRDSPKFVFSTNYMLNLKGNHGKRRARVFEFSPFFGPEKTPVDHFGHLLFDGWDRYEWIRFYNLMFMCVSAYLAAGIARVDQTDKLKRKTLKTQWGEEFVEWYLDFIDPKNDNLGRAKMQMELFNNFVTDNGFSSKDYSVKRFKYALTAAGKLLEIPTEFRKKNTGREVVVGVPGLTTSPSPGANNPSQTMLNPKHWSPIPQEMDFEK